MLELKTWLFSLHRKPAGWSLYWIFNIWEKLIAANLAESICKVVDPWVHKSGQVIA